MVEIETRIRPTGNSYCLYIPTALIKCKVLDPTRKVRAILMQELAKTKKIVSQNPTQVSNYQNKQTKSIYKFSKIGERYIEPIYLLALSRVRKMEVSH